MARYVEILFRRWLIFGLLLFVAPPTAAALSVVLFPWHQASSQIWVENPIYFGAVPSANGWNQYLTPSQNAVDSLSQLFSTSTFMRQIGDDLLASGTVGTPAERDNAMQSTAGTFTVVADGSHLVIVGVSCRKTAVCLRALGTAVRLHQDWLKQSEQIQAQVAIDFYAGQLKIADDHLASAETALNSYAAQHPGESFDPNNPTSTTDPQLAGLIQKVQDAKNTERNLQDKLDGIRLSSAAANQIDQTVLRVIDPPTVQGGNLFPAASRKTAVIVGGGALLPGLVYLVLLAWLDRKIRSPKEVESRLGLRVIPVPRLNSKHAA